MLLLIERQRAFGFNREEDLSERLDMMAGSKNLADELSHGRLALARASDQHESASHWRGVSEVSAFRSLVLLASDCGCETLRGD